MIEKRFEELNRRLEQLPNPLEGREGMIEKRFEEMNHRLDQLRDALDELRGKRHEKPKQEPKVDPEPEAPKPEPSGAEA
jgi:DNA repair exonuclease SbcCD ATPase subunit